MKIRIAKFIADNGAASRREAERLIESGAVRVNGAVIESPVFFVGPQDKIEIRGKRIDASAKTRVFAFNKPIDIMTTAHDPNGRRTIYDALPEKCKNLKYVGRLDFKTAGLLLLTNNGELARRLTLPANGIIREYEAKLHPKNIGEIKSGTIARNLRRFLSPMSSDDSIFDAARRGLTLGGVHYAPMDIEILSRYPLNVRIRLQEGKKNEIRIVFDYLGLPVSKLRRVAYGPIKLGNLAPGEIRELNKDELKKISDSNN
ncbi:MAG: rRNA pseudouridine synthase [Rickettsiales bacterium]|jgi:23S rRNA pseudouridine2605 synthase|nr:rRNA pseudouridine synthase [Rickettsiales bacterium]